MFTCKTSFCSNLSRGKESGLRKEFHDLLGRVGHDGKRIGILVLRVHDRGVKTCIGGTDQLDRAFFDFLSKINQLLEKQISLRDQSNEPDNSVG